MRRDEIAVEIEPDRAHDLSPRNVLARDHDVVRPWRVELANHLLHVGSHGITSRCRRSLPRTRISGRGPVAAFSSEVRPGERHDEVPERGGEYRAPANGVRRPRA